ncbi:MAG: response regulator [Halobacteriota archaeon]
MTIRALIVDDSALQRSIIRDILEDRFEIVGEAENGRDAVRAFLREEPDLVTMDIMMPKLDGIEATGKIKDHAPETKIVMCTSVGQEEKMRDAVKNGADGYVMKPFEEDDLVSAVTEAIGG